MKAVKLFPFISAVGVRAVAAVLLVAAPAAAQNANYMIGAEESQLLVNDNGMPSAYGTNMQGLQNQLSPEEFAGLMGAAAYAEGSSTYTLGPTDIIDIRVSRHPEVSGIFPINKEGKIQYEFVGDVVVAGLTKDQITEKLTDILSEYIINPDVLVKIAAYNSKQVFVIGEVGRPGRISMRGDTITVREALLAAGLPLLTANTRKGRMFTPSDRGKIEKHNIDVYALLYEGDLRENFTMKPGDTLYVPPTIWARATRVINPVAQPIGTAAGTSRTVTGTGY